jgi:hypothetical protein
VWAIVAAFLSCAPAGGPKAKIAAAKVAAIAVEILIVLSSHLTGLSG